MRPRWGALVLLLVALLVYASIALPETWHAAFKNAVKWLAGQTASFASTVDQTLLAIIVGSALLVLICGVMLLPPRRRGSTIAEYLASRVPATPFSLPNAPISVYLDAENEPGELDDEHPEEAMEMFITALRQRLRGQRADLLFYMGSEFPIYKDRQKQLHRYGFRLIDVPHDPYDVQAGKDKEKNMVDMELGLHAYRRSLATPYPQDIIIVANDQDYIPLLYRLWADGHRVELWAYNPSPAFYELAAATEKIGPQAIVVNKFGTGSVSAYATVRDVARLPQDVAPIAEMVALLKAEIARSIELLNTLLHNAPTPKEQRYIYQGEIERQLRDSLALLGYSGSRYATCWITHLRCVDALSAHQHPVEDRVSADAQTRPTPFQKTITTYTVGSASVETATEYMISFLTVLAQTSYKKAAQSPGRRIPLATLCEAIFSKFVPDATTRLKYLLRPEREDRFNHMRYFLQCARALGLVAYDGDALREDGVLLQPLPAASPQPNIPSMPADNL